MKTFTGVVTSTSMTHTITVSVVHRWTHPIYKKAVKRTKKYLVHCLSDQVKVGDTVTFTGSKPLSKRKRFAFKSIETQ